MALSLLVVFGGIIYIIYQYFTDASYHKVKQMELQARAQQEANRDRKDRLVKKFNDEGFTFYDYYEFKAEREKITDALNAEDPEMFALIGIDPDIIPKQSYMPKKVYSYPFPDSFISKVYCICEAIILYNKKIAYYQWKIDGKFPDIDRMQRQLKWLCDSYKYYMMSNADFEKAIGRKLTFEELTKRGRLIDEYLLPPITCPKEEVQYLCEYGELCYWWKDTAHCYDGNNHPDMYGMFKTSDALYEWYGGDTDNEFNNEDDTEADD